MMQKLRAISVARFRFYSKKIEIPEPTLLDYKCGTPDHKALEKALNNLVKNRREIPISIGTEQIFTGDCQFQRMPHNHTQCASQFCYTNLKHVQVAIDSCLKNWQQWAYLPFTERSDIFMRCIDIIEKEDRHLINAALMLGQSKSASSADEDTYTLIKKMRETVASLMSIAYYKPKKKAPGFCTHLEMRPLEGFVAAVSPFNMIHLVANLVFAPAIMGNTVLWKPANNCVLASAIVLESLIKAGMPYGVINFMPSNAKLFLDTVIKSPHMAGMAFTGRVATFQSIWHNIGIRLSQYHNFPRLLSECGGKNFHFMHESADVELAAKKTVKAAFDYSGQKGTSCSRAYVPAGLWDDFRCILQEEVKNVKIGDPLDMSIFTSAVINEFGYNHFMQRMEKAKKDPETEIILGGEGCKSVGYFVEPTVILTKNPKHNLMSEEVLGPLLCIYIYNEKDVDETLKITAESTPYAYCGAIFAKDSKFVCRAVKALRMAASNLYVNEMCIGRPWGYLPYSGNRLSSSNIQVPSGNRLHRWNSPLSIQVNIATEEKCQN